MNILFSSDDNYARHMGVAIISILQHNRDVERIRFYVINNQITLSNLEKLEMVVNEYENAEISFIPFKYIEKHLHLSLSWPISLSSYARLFVGELLPIEVERVLYLDCDIVIKDSLSSLWEIDLQGRSLGAIQDTIPSKTKASVGLLPQQPYFNAGVLLIDLRRWRIAGIGQKCLEFIDAHKGCVNHHDQGVLNGIFNGAWIRLPLRFNVMTVHYMISQTKVRKFYKDDAVFYDLAEINGAISNPVILHFTPSFTNRPWEKNCSHPLRHCYNYYLRLTPWKETPLVSSQFPWYVELINLRYRYFPVF